MEPRTPRISSPTAVRDLLGNRPITAKRMFGGLTFLLSGNMLCCVSAKGLMARIGRRRRTRGACEALCCALPWHRTADGGFILVEPPGVASGGDLKGWLALALATSNSFRRRRPSRRAAANGRKHQTPLGTGVCLTC